MVELLVPGPDHALMLINTPCGFDVAEYRAFVEYLWTLPDCLPVRRAMADCQHEISWLMANGLGDGRLERATQALSAPCLARASSRHNIRSC